MASPTACLVGGGERGRDHRTGAAGSASETGRKIRYPVEGTGRRTGGGAGVEYICALLKIGDATKVKNHLTRCPRHPCHRSRRVRSRCERHARGKRHRCRRSRHSRPNNRPRMRHSQAIGQVFTVRRQPSCGKNCPCMARLRVALQPALLGLVGLVHVAPELLSHQPHRQRPTHFQR